VRHWPYCSCLARVVKESVAENSMSAYLTVTSLLKLDWNRCAPA